MPASSSSSPRGRTTARTRTVRVGLALFVVGLAFMVAVVVPYFFGDHNRSLWLNIGCMLAPLGFVVAVTGVFRAGRDDQRAAFEELAGNRGS